MSAAVAGAAYVGLLALLAVAGGKALKELRTEPVEETEEPSSTS